MKKMARTVLMAGALIGSAVTLGACAYGGVAVAGGDKVIITRNDGLLFGALRKIYVCEMAEGGLSNCVETQAP